MASFMNFLRYEPIENYAKFAWRNWKMIDSGFLVVPRKNFCDFEFIFDETFRNLINFPFNFAGSLPQRFLSVKKTHLLLHWELMWKLGKIWSFSDLSAETNDLNLSQNIEKSHFFWNSCKRSLSKNRHNAGDLSWLVGISWLCLIKILVNLRLILEFFVKNFNFKNTIAKISRAIFAFYENLQSVILEWAYDV